MVDAPTLPSSRWEKFAEPILAGNSDSMRAALRRLGISEEQALAYALTQWSAAVQRLFEIENLMLHGSNPPWPACPEHKWALKLLISHGRVFLDAWSAMSGVNGLEFSYEDALATVESLEEKYDAVYPPQKFEIHYSVMSPSNVLR